MFVLEKGGKMKQINMIKMLSELSDAKYTQTYGQYDALERIVIEYKDVLRILGKYIK